MRAQRPGGQVGGLHAGPGGGAGFRAAPAIAFSNAMKIAFQFSCTGPAGVPLRCLFEIRLFVSFCPARCTESAQDYAKMFHWEPGSAS